MEILLLTNRDSDNTGDQVIEASDIALIETVMRNLNYAPFDYNISSRAASIVTQKYLATKDPSLLKNAEKAIKKADIIIFGGAPLFNYLYQNFYERTAVTLELAHKYEKPVIFSAIGIEHYDEDNAKCQRLKTTLNYDCVKQITTRDGYDKLEKFRSNENIVIGKVSDPAVFSGEVFRNYTNRQEADFARKIVRYFKGKIKKQAKEKKKKKIGLFILRANGFKDNHYDFSRDDAAKLWKDLIAELKSKGYDYELITSGHFGDEAFIYYLIQEYGVDSSKCVFNIDTPEALLTHLSAYDGVISCRLHPSIISFSLNIPCLGIEWNNKVRRFYESIGYKDRVVDVDGIQAKDVVLKLEQAMQEGVNKDQEYLMSVYTTLFNGIKNILFSDDTDISPYSYEELLDNLPPFEGTSEKEAKEKLKRKFRRVYLKFNEVSLKNAENNIKIADLKKQIEKLTEENKKLSRDN